MKAESKAQYQCAPNDSAVVQLDLFNNGSFSLEVSSFDEQKNLSDPVVYHGIYKEGPYTFDLDFKDVPHSQIEDLFHYTKEGGFIQGTNIYRMNKEPGLLYIHGCLVVQKTRVQN